MQSTHEIDEYLIQKVYKAPLSAVSRRSPRATGEQPAYTRAAGDDDGEHDQSGAARLAQRVSAAVVEQEL